MRESRVETHDTFLHIVQAADNRGRHRSCDSLESWRYAQVLEHHAGILRIQPTTTNGTMPVADEMVWAQATTMAFGILDESSVYLCTGSPLPSDIRAIAHLLFNSTFKEAYDGTCVTTRTHIR